ncbi:MAG: sulfite exporter TauE/SafE family protein [Candidatus Pacebacteria bacterium]|nr:sulfite exporter TauE/SafE family protein [Candidatus Paceibacterota bacterium]
MAHKKIILHIKGMHCRSCEILLEQNISEVEGVKKIITNYKKGIAEIEHFGDTPRMREIEKAINNAGYTLGLEDKKHFFSRNPKDYAELAVAACSLFLIYTALRVLGVFDINLNLSGTPGLVGVLLVGLTAGVSTCMALIGGLVLGISSRHAELHPDASTKEKFRPHIFFNLGRLASYALLGGFIGLLGSAFKLSSPVLGSITLILGIVMLFLGLKLTEIFPKLHNKGLVLPKAVSKFFGLKTETKEYSHRGAFITGVLTFFVPCGFTQAMQLYAVSTGSFTQGALIMGIFALGTLPGIIGIGGLTSAIRGSFARHFFKFAGLVVVALAFFNIITGFNLTGWSLPSLPSFGSITQSVGGSSNRPVEIIDGKQVVYMTQEVGGYSPNKFTIKKGIPVLWKITSESQFTCAAYISMPSSGIRKPLKLGENIIEFTPTQTGVMKFTCSMGMYTGVFNVID